LHLRAEITEGGRREKLEAGGNFKKHTGERFAFKLFAAVMTRPGVYELSSRLGRLLQRAVVRRGRIGKVGGIFARLASPLRAWTNARDLRPIADSTFREQWQAGLHSHKGPSLNPVEDDPRNRTNQHE
jgi:hypothetical protein